MALPRDLAYMANHKDPFRLTCLSVALKLCADELHTEHTISAGAVHNAVYESRRIIAPKHIKCAPILEQNVDLVLE